MLSIGIPTYNRVEGLRRALASALVQDYPRLEILISDNASVDETEAVCRSLLESDARIRYVRQAQNRGATANFRYILDSVAGEYFMWLADDDWLEPGYASAAMAPLIADRSLALATGTGVFQASAVRPELRDCQPGYRQHPAWRRSLAYLAGVGYNSVIYGIMRRDFALAASLPNCLGGDWIFISTLLLQGGSVSVPGAIAHRARGGDSATFPRLLASLGLPAWQRFLPWVMVAWNNGRALQRDLAGHVGRNMAFKAGWLAFLIVIHRYSWWRRFYPGRRRRAWIAGFARGDDGRDA